jgi:hypothetical protein
VAAAIYLALLVRMFITAMRHGQAHRPMLVNYAALAFALAVPFMVLGLVLWVGLPWWFLVLFVPFVAMRLVMFRLGSALSRRQ